MIQQSEGNRIQVSYSQFRTQLEKGNIPSILVRGEKITGEFQSPVQIDQDERKVEVESFLTFLPSFGDESLLEDLRKQEVEVRTQPESDYSWWIILANVFPLLLLFALFFLFYRRAQSQGRGLLQMKKSRAKTYSREDESTTFEDVAGAKGAKTELKEIIDFLKDPSKFHQLGGVIPRGILLVGPPGTGKTLLARAVAGEADVPFFSITGSDFMEMFVGVGASRVRNLFEEAKKNAPSIIFIDELDSIGRRRGAGLGGGHDEREQTLNQLLSEMDGFEQSHSVVVMAATNRPDILDRALLRPGRFDRRISVDMPTSRERLAILKIHAKEKKVSDSVDLEQIARSTPGFSGADLENLLNEAALMAARQDKDEIDNDSLLQAKDKVMMGLTRESLVLTDEEKRILAYHEGGHAIVGAVLLERETIQKVSIVPRGQSMGATHQIPEEDHYLYRRDYLKRKLALILGGRASETLVFDEISSGAADDLKKATQIARRMILEWGMSERFGCVSLGGEREQVFLGEEIAQRREYSEQTSREVDEEVLQILEDAMERAMKTLRDYRKALEELAELLLEDEEVPGNQVTAILESYKD